MSLLDSIESGLSDFSLDFIYFYRLSQTVALIIMTFAVDWALVIIRLEVQHTLRIVEVGCVSKAKEMEQSRGCGAF